MRLYDAGYFDARAEVVKILDTEIKIGEREDLLYLKALRDQVLNLQPTPHVSPTPDLPQYVRNHDD